MLTRRYRASAALPSTARFASVATQKLHSLNRDVFYVADPISSIVVTDCRRRGFIDAANAPESLKQRILNGVE